MDPRREGPFRASWMRRHVRSSAFKAPQSHAKRLSCRGGLLVRVRGPRWLRDSLRRFKLSLDRFHDLWYRVDMTMILNVRAGHLSAAFQNALTFADDVLVNFILLIVDGSRMSVISTDGFVSICDRLDIENPNGDEYEWFCLPLTEAEKLFEYIKNVKDLKTRPGWVTLSFDKDRLRTRDNVDGAEHSYPLVQSGAENRFIMLLRRFFEFEEYFEVVGDSPVAIHPERLRDIARVKLHCSPELKKFLVMDMAFVRNPGNPHQDLMYIKYGPDVRIILAGINRQRNMNTLMEAQDGMDVVKECLWIRGEDPPLS